jgi:hypothetical protein
VAPVRYPSRGVLDCGVLDCKAPLTFRGLGEESDRDAPKGREGRVETPSLRRVMGYPVVALQVSVLPNPAGHSPSGQGAGSASSPAANEAAR